MSIPYLCPYPWSMKGGLAPNHHTNHTNHPFGFSPAAGRPDQSTSQPHFAVSGSRARQAPSLHPLAKQQAHATMAFLQPAPVVLRILVAEDNKVNQKVVLKVRPVGK